MRELPAVLVHHAEIHREMRGQRSGRKPSSGTTRFELSRA